MTEDLIEPILRDIQTRLGRIEDVLIEHTRRLGRIEQNLAAVGVAAADESVRIDRLTERVNRIERRLELRDIP